jgi:hypothetical protein
MESRSAEDQDASARAQSAGAQSALGKKPASERIFRPALVISPTV